MKHHNKPFFLLVASILLPILIVSSGGIANILITDPIGKVFGSMLYGLSIAFTLLGAGYDLPSRLKRDLHTHESAEESITLYIVGGILGSTLFMHSARFDSRPSPIAISVMVTMWCAVFTYFKIAALRLSALSVRT